MNWQGEKIIIIGAARQGIALAKYLDQRGANVTLTDLRAPEELSSAREALSSNTINWVLGEHPISLLDDAALVCPSGGVPLTVPLIQEALARGIPLSNDSQIFLEAAPCPSVGITGSAGKTTTTTLVGEIAQAAEGSGVSPFRNTHIGGNIGNPLISQVPALTAQDLAVLELSSFQLELMTASPQTAVILNITPNHLDRHGTMEAYTSAKRHILDHQTEDDLAILSRQDPNTWALRHAVKGRLYSFGLNPLPKGSYGAYINEEAIYVRLPAGDFRVISLSEINLPGTHNLLNVLAAVTITAAVGFPVSIMQAAVTKFRGVAHRLEFVRRWKDTDWYNDSKATGPESTIQALRSFNQPIILLAGGRDKDLPWDSFAKAAEDAVTHLILFGEARDTIQAALPDQRNYSLDLSESLQVAVQAAAKLAADLPAGGVVLLSPGCTSFDEFKDFEDRGEKFKAWVTAFND